MKTFIKLIANLILGAIIFIAGAYFAASNSITLDNDAQESEVKMVTPGMPDYTEDIKGTWTPVDVAKGELSFQYGVLHHHTKSEYGAGYVDREYPYSVRGTHLKLENKYPGVHGIKDALDLPMMIYEESGVTYLEISDVPGFSGKYKKTK
ncbi:MAG: hypothetical protein J5695_06715 [Bacteroidales bacterium]|nr:hypothetical protein [Bacteroidales bacterium]